MEMRVALLYLSILIYSTLSAAASADPIHGCGGFVEASSSLVKSRKATDAKLDYSNIRVELQTLDGLVKDRTQCAPNGYYFIPVYDKGSFVISISGPEGWSWDPEKVPIVVDDSGCNHNEDINFQFTGFTLSGRVVGAVGGESCSDKNGGPSNVNVELLSHTGDVISSVATSPLGIYLFKNVIPGQYKLRASHPDLEVEARGSTEVGCLPIYFLVYSRCLYSSPPSLSFSASTTLPSLPPINHIYCSQSFIKYDYLKLSV
uniref:Nodal modulator 1 n=1 Tax=Rhizophora mucronata TaxID=61149 RepID=A0A2P2M7K7_RHIMU